MSQQQLISDFYKKVGLKFDRLTFKEETHEYFVEGNKVPLSVSGVVKGFVPFTDWDAIATAVAKRDERTKESVIAEWEAKKNKGLANGTKTHDFAEHRNRVAETEKEEAVVKFWKILELDNPYRYVLVAKELRMYHKLYKFCGTCDFILYDTLTNTYIIGDYKTNIDLFKNYNGNLLLEPFEFLLDHAYNQYQIQLSSYQILLEQIEGVMVTERWLIHLRDDGTPHCYKTYDYSNYLINYFNSLNKENYLTTSVQI